MYKTLGIIGGMGPAATCDLMQKIISLTAADCDQKHIHIISDVNTNIPDRTAAILHGGEDPVPEMTKSALRLKNAGADYLIIPCNTAHYFYDAVAQAAQIPVLHMPRLTAQVLREAGVKRAGVLATDGTVQSGVYGKVLQEVGVEPVYPQPEHQKLIMSLIYDGVKGGKIALSDIPVQDILTEMRSRGAEKFLLACTELPIAFERLGLTRDCLDPTRVLAHAAVEYAGAPTTGGVWG